MKCAVWDELYEEYEKAMRHRVAQKKKIQEAREVPALEQLNAEVAKTLQDLRRHEQDHRCNG